MKKISYLLIVIFISWFSVLTNAATLNVSTTPELREALTTAATNGEDDTIILEGGTYKTTDDGEGSFVYFSNEINSLTLKGIDEEDVTLSGDLTHSIVSFTSTKDASIVLNKISFINGYNKESGGAVFSGLSIGVLNCNFENNVSDSFGGALALSHQNNAAITITNSTFSGNFAYSNGGGIFAQARRVTANINGSSFELNSTTDSFDRHLQGWGGAVYIMENR